MTGETTEIKFNQLCRVCLTKSGEMRQLLNPSGGVSDLVGKLASIIKSEIDMANKTHPNNICWQCEEKLELCYDFQQLSLRSHQTILEYTNIESVDVKPSHQVKQELEGIAEEISIIYANSDDANENDNSSDDNYLNEDDDDEEVKPKSKRRVSVRSKSTKKVVICDSEEVTRYIMEVKRKFYTPRNCLFCGFTSSNVRTLSVHMSRLHGIYKDKWCWKCNEIQEDLKHHSKGHKNEFQCPFCHKKSTTSSHFVEHLSRHTVKRKHICQLCQKDFISTKHLRAHCRKAHNGQVYSCRDCLENFVDKQSLLEHIKVHKTIHCKICEEQFSKEKYGSHLCFKKEKFEIIFEESDDKKNDNIENTNAENIEKTCKSEDAKKGDVKPHRFCEICKRNVRNLMNHIDKHHNKDSNSDVPKALCIYCGKQFKHQSNLDVHMRTHTKETPYKCSYCEVSVATRTRLVDHERTHTGEKPFVCRFCGKAFKQHGVLNTHLKIHTGRTEQCLLCPKRFCRPSELRNHMRVHTGEKPFACSYCDKCFIQRSHLVEHTKIHTDHRPFKCNICGKAFKQSSTLKGHLLVHDGKKMFNCTICAYSCRKSYTLKQHLLQHQNTHAETYSCDICEESFPNLELLDAHRSSHQDGLELANIVDMKF